MNDHLQTGDESSFIILPSNAEIVLDELKKVLKSKLATTPEQELALELLISIEKGYRRELKTE